MQSKMDKDNHKETKESQRKLPELQTTHKIVQIWHHDYLKPHPQINWQQFNNQLIL